MKKYTLLFILFLIPFTVVFTQQTVITSYTKKSFMIPMRDGIKLFTVVLTPTEYDQPLPFLLQRTPYGADWPVKEDSALGTDHFPPYYRSMATEGYILVFQDIRGKFNSQGSFEMNRPVYHLEDKSKTDESTDAYDTIDWLIKNISNNNGKAGIFGISYDGYTALDAAINPHPALKASSPQASPADMFLGDDFHHNGAFRLSYGFEYSYYVENNKGANSIYPFPQFDLFDWYLKLGPLKNVNEKYFKGKLAAWNDFAGHPNYDAFWQRQSMLNNLHVPQLPIMHVGGYFDQEDLNGPQIMYHHLEKKDSFNRNFIVLGPWSHGQWAGRKADSLGNISFENLTALWFQELQRKWFDYWLKGIGDGKFTEANCFQTGSNQWKTYDRWPPLNAGINKLYVNADYTASYSKPGNSKGAVSFVSDPAKPIPYRTQPIEATYGFGSRWSTWHVEDQRFVSSRPDVLSFIADAQQEDLTVTGKIVAHLFASTSGTDADFIVKLIDVYPDVDNKNKLMSGYQLPVAMEVFRGRFRKGFEKPRPLIPNKPEEFVIDLHDINHTFLKGHHLMIQIQSSWFPIIDRNPQKYVPNIFEAKENDFIKATHTIYCNNQYPTYIELPVMKE